MVTYKGKPIINESLKKGAKRHWMDDGIEIDLDIKMPPIEKFIVKAKIVSPKRQLTSLEKYRQYLIKEKMIDEKGKLCIAKVVS